MHSPETQALVPSVFDRLLGADSGGFQTRTQQLRDLKLSVRRDIENLLNTRWRCQSWPPDLDQLDQSLVNYGIPDFTGVVQNQGTFRQELRSIIESVLRKFEPRFKSVRVELIQNPDESDRVLRLRIDALLHVEPAPEPVVFESQLEPTRSEFHVEASS